MAALAWGGQHERNRQMPDGRIRRPGRRHAGGGRKLEPSDRTVYLVDLDALTPVEGVVTTRLARVPAQGPATDLSRETEEVMVRCSDGQSRSGASVTYDASGAETDRYSEDTPWEATPNGGVYGAIKSFACDNMRPESKSWPTIQAFIEDGRGK